jgi:hypothetical protein
LALQSPPDKLIRSRPTTREKKRKGEEGLRCDDSAHCSLRWSTVQQGEESPKKTKVEWEGASKFAFRFKKIAIKGAEVVGFSASAKWVTVRISSWYIEWGRAD